METPTETGIERSTPPGEIKRRAVRGSAVTLGAQAIAFVVGLGTTAVMARLLTPEDYGVVAMVVAFVGLATVFRDLGLSGATIQRHEISHAEVSGLFWINVFTGLVLMIIMTACAPLVVAFYGRPELYWLTLAYAALTPVSSLGAQHHALLQRSMRYGSIARRDLVATGAGALAGIAGAISGLGYWALYAMQATTAGVGTAALWWHSRWRPGRPQHPRRLAPLLAFGGALTLSNFLAFATRGLDGLVIGRFVGAAGLGLYVRAQGVVLRPLEQVVPPIMSVSASAFSRLAPTPELFASTGFRFLGALSVVAGLVVALVMGTADWIVDLLLGPQWSDAVPIVRALALFAFVEPCAGLLGTLLVAGGHPLRLARWRIVSTLIIVCALVVGLPWGPLGVALAMSGTGLLIRTPLFVVYSGRLLGLGPSRIFRILGGPLLSGLAVSATLIALRAYWPVASLWVGLPVYCSFGTLLYLALTLVTPLGRATLRDLFLSARLLTGPDTHAGEPAPRPGL